MVGWKGAVCPSAVSSMYITNKGQRGCCSPNCCLWCQARVKPGFSASNKIHSCLSLPLEMGFWKPEKMKVNRSFWQVSVACACNSLLQWTNYQVRLTYCEHKLIRFLILFSDFRMGEKKSILPFGKEIWLTCSHVSTDLHTALGTARVTLRAAAIHLLYFLVTEHWPTKKMNSYLELSFLISSL